MLGPLAMPASNSHAEYVECVRAMPEMDRPAYFGLPVNIERSSQVQASQAAIGELRKLARLDTRATRFYKELWSQELTPVLNFWKKLNQCAFTTYLLTKRIPVLYELNMQITAISCARSPLQGSSSCSRSPRRPTSRR